jgi:protein-disulfide isomerase
MKSVAFSLALSALALGTPARAAELLTGSATAPVQLLIYGDIQCPFTKKMIGYLDRFEADYGTKIGVQFANFPLSFHAEARPAAIADLCAARQDVGVAYLKEEFAHQDKLGHAYYLELAKTLGVRDLRGFADCLDDKNMAAEVDADVAAGTKAGVNATPTMFLQGEKIAGAYPYEDFKKKIDKALQ